MIEAELKARLRYPDIVRSALADRAEPEFATYHDTYYDTPDDDLDATGRELRLRSIDSNGIVLHLLTFKEPAVDEASGSKPEYESRVDAPEAVDHVLRALGHRRSVELTKRCENYKLSAGGRGFLATVVRVPEIDGTFLEVETMAGEDDVTAALDAVRDLLAELGVDRDELTTDLYTDAVRAARSSR